MKNSSKPLRLAPAVKKKLNLSVPSKPTAKPKLSLGATKNSQPGLNLAKKAPATKLTLPPKAKVSPRVINQNLWSSLIPEVSSLMSRLVNSGDTKLPPKALESVVTGITQVLVRFNAARRLLASAETTTTKPQDAEAQMAAYTRSLVFMHGLVQSTNEVFEKSQESDNQEAKKLLAEARSLAKKNFQTYLLYVLQECPAIVNYTEFSCHEQWLKLLQELKNGNNGVR